jgi:hypothetical protein
VSRVRRRWWLALLTLVVVLLAGAWAATRQPSRGADESLDAVRLGPTSGQPVAAYLAGLPARLPAPNAPPVPALVQFAAERDVADAARLLAGVRPVTAVFRVPLPRVQTALRFQRLPPVDLPDPAAAVLRRLTLGERAAGQAAGQEAGRLSGRPSAIAGYEAAVLARPGSDCVLAVLVVAGRAGLASVTARPGVRAVDAAPEGTPVDGVALAPLLPEQSDLVAPVPDDGPVPAAPPPR